MRALMLPIGEERYAVALDAVREVIEAPPIVRVPSRDRHVRGVFNLRGEIVAALDTGRLLGGRGTAAPDDARWWAVVRAGDRVCALAATDTPGNVELGEAAGPGTTPGVRARHLVDGNAVALLDLDALLGADRSRAGSGAR